MIEFRGKNEEGRWFYGSLRYFKYQVNQIDIKKYFIVHETDIHGHRVVFETIGQYALAQALGVKVFTGDILSEKWRAEVYQDAQTGTFMVHLHGDIFSSRVTLQDYLIRRKAAGTLERDHKIIGNIHDNPELLEVHV